MGSTFSLAPCSRFLEDHEWAPEEVFIQKMMRRALENDGSKLALIVAAMPVEDPTGTSLTLFPPGVKINTIWIEKLEKVKTWGPLGNTWGSGRRVDTQTEFDSFSSRSQAKSQQHSRDHWRAKIITENGSGEHKEQWCLLQVATSHQERTTEHALNDIKAANQVASYARDYNMILHTMASPTGEPAPCVRVCVPIGCKVIQSPVPHFFVPGDMITLLPYQADEVAKFVTNGRENYLEIPQTFFHYVAWKSDCRECVVDLMGIEEDDGSILLVNPHLVRAPESNIVSNFVSTQDGAVTPAHVTPEMFDRLHPQCGPLCRSFDPERRSKPGRKHCGLTVGCGTRGNTCHR